ncbi:AfsR/SARP family transcriptional regulator [Actinocrispum wychmicini]|uniref:DNA-binding SARP family transcriptional activator n=1 Tax=Actinocrispum wychmicini TaxID=1213861 RepID=A0A4V6NNT5_9PSEU|nr:AfsR/SARP family transcriptional regulator [Actinocrispum wychmicini]TCO55020.1 DNA-binding SARP family transcriptional activator [Actinocrispum wychmicini]
MFKVACLRFGVLGPLTVVNRDGAPVALRGSRLPALLTELLFNANKAVSFGRLVEVLWGDEPPKSYVSNLHTYVSRLRERLDGVPIDLVAGGYRISLDTADLDLLVFRAETEAGRAAAAPTLAAAHFRRALDQWRGTDFAQPHLELEAVRLEAERIMVVEEWVDAELAAGRATAVIGELTTYVREYPLRERFAAQLMVALARAGRRAEALTVYHQTRTELIDQLGIEPGPLLRRIQSEVLAT